MRKMAGMALGQGAALQQDEVETAENPIAKAAKIQEQVIANSMMQNTISQEAAKTRKAEADASKAEAEAQRAVNGGGEKAEKDGFKVTGGIRYNVDMDEERRRSEERTERLQKESAESAQRMNTENNQLKEQIHNEQIAALKEGVLSEIAKMNAMIQSQAAQGTFIDQYNATIEMAKALGLNKDAGASDLIGQIELKKLDFEQSIQLRRLTEEDKERDRKYQLDLKRLDDERDQRRLENQRSEARDSMFAELPKRILPN